MSAVTYPNWFEVTARASFEKHLLPLAGQPDLRFLQIGVFTGDATVWLLDNVLTGPFCSLTDVDTWEGSDEPAHDAMDFADVERVYDERRFDDRVRKFKGTSEDYFLLHLPSACDFIYIDGDHTAYGVLNDAVNAYRHLKVGGLLAFDDFTWTSGKGDPYDPGLAISAFAAIYSDRFEVVEVGAQVWLRKT